MKLLGWLVTALVVVSLWAAFATWRWSTGGARCDTRIAEQRAEDFRDAIEAQGAALGKATEIFGEELARSRGEGVSAAGNTHTRETLIREARVTGECVMPAGLPSLTPAVEEARAAARD
ncbi:hypothetical protein [Luteimonas fraxinea]|uniref:DUF2570 domain-containing protein n=1 Tax=Luteimonas fraxinea TaxID=2901869 RepID=A0ABS8U9K6_9GAMM|nr:hypothetical protein [Luteimonas fraxinea]MCD9096180.1 hypothetical protein [Luteimonas fraxinea]